MHAEARDGMARMIAASGLDTARPLVALDLGGADVNGTTRDLFPGALWAGLDIEAGPGVDIVADARSWESAVRFDVVACTELLEHVERWAECVDTAWFALKPGGFLFVTAASTGRPAHGARGGPAPLPGEWYGNVDPDEVRDALSLFAESHVEFNPNPGDVYAWARK